MSWDKAGSGDGKAEDEADTTEKFHQHKQREYVYWDIGHW